VLTHTVYSSSPAPLPKDVRQPHTTINKPTFLEEVHPSPQMEQIRSTHTSKSQCSNLGHLVLYQSKHSCFWCSLLSVSIAVNIAAIPDPQKGTPPTHIHQQAKQKTPFPNSKKMAAKQHKAIIWPLTVADQRSIPTLTTPPLVSIQTQETKKTTSGATYPHARTSYWQYAHKTTRPKDSELVLHKTYNNRPSHHHNGKPAIYHNK